MYLLRSTALREEYEDNDKYAPPSGKQLRWHVRHIREDMMLLCRQKSYTNCLLTCILLVLIKIAFF
jgi:hypothetical protein